jgi:hypothetical protein
MTTLDGYLLIQKRNIDPAFLTSSSEIERDHSGTRNRVLVVDDEELIASSLTEILRGGQVST